ncbi:hypothetical protein MKL09_27220 [Methylobacterium sp. J-048]|uniref:hypothetical protein n=1 Tax=unclassified Methylobacterium TaxID=2615210 RepID=UPI001FBA41C4|nr:MULTISPECIES: hypothetical protein [unclassified Methylobacterium]MCJ2060206.1 hypothetical protein [Methylobacterium sp. J-048]MCJ2094939.1 hypothetical protein [Methylobacterium sp. J-072]
MSDPEPDEIFRERLLRVVAEHDRHMVMFARGAMLDLLGRKYDRFRTGIPLKGLGDDAHRSASEPVGAT